MSKNRLARKAKFLFVIWCALYGLFGAGSRIYVSYQQAINGIDPTAFLSPFQLASWGIVSLVFLPSLFGIYHLIKQSDAQRLKKIVRWLLCILCIWVAAMTCFTIAAAIIPGFPW